MAGPSALQTHLGYWLRFASNHVSQRFAERLAERGVTVAEWVVLRILYDAAEVSPSEVAETIGMTRGAVSKIAERLVARAWVVRREREGDRRYQKLALTAAGRRMVPVCASLADQNDAEFFAPLARGEREALRSALEKLIEAHGLRRVPTE